MTKTDKDGVKYLKIGKGYYSTANERILALKRMYPDSEINTHLTYMPEIKSWKAITSVTVSLIDNITGNELYHLENTGHACKSTEDPVWGKVAAESAETSSVSRAIAKLGIGIEFSHASADEVSQSGIQFEMIEEEPEQTEKSKDIENELIKQIKKGKK